MRIAIIGKGRVGTALGDGWKRAGHHVTYTERQADVVVLAIPWAAVESVAGQLSGQIVLDCTNGGGEHVAGWIANARVVKIFNTTGFENMANPRFGDEAATMFYAGDDAEAKAIADGLAADLGFDPVDAGPLSMAGTLDALARLWITLAHKQNLGRGIAFRLLRR